ncbi:MAG TPA: hypothetical protein VGT44_15235 [Ktedonobacteraceae bacterium]|nr:hypothetical protein [Ktedonobacteraceae bacterium]
MSYSIEIHIDVEELQLPGDLTALEQIEAAIEGMVVDVLEPWVSTMAVREVMVNLISQAERDWDALLK